MLMATCFCDCFSPRTQGQHAVAPTCLAQFLQGRCRMLRVLQKEERFAILMCIRKKVLVHTQHSSSISWQSNRCEGHWCRPFVGSCFDWNRWICDQRAFAKRAVHCRLRPAKSKCPPSLSRRVPPALRHAEQLGQWLGSNIHDATQAADTFTPATKTARVLHDGACCTTARAARRRVLHDGTSMSSTPSHQGPVHCASSVYIQYQKNIHTLTHSAARSQRQG